MKDWEKEFDEQYMNYLKDGEEAFKKPIEEIK